MKNNWTVVVTPPPSSDNDSVVTEEYIYKVSKELGYPIFPINKFIITGSKDEAQYTPEDVVEYATAMGIKQKIYADKKGGIYYLPRNNMENNYLEIGIYSEDDEWTYNDYFDAGIIAVDYDLDAIIFYIRRNEYFPEAPEKGKKSSSYLDTDGQLINVGIYYGSGPKGGK